MKQATSIPSDMMAPCGMNCGICRAYLREKNKCPGCNHDPAMLSCKNCKMRICKKRGGSFCFECNEFPCDKVKHIDKRYRTKYGMSMIENLNKIKEIGLMEFMKIENTRWVCPKCGGQICVHNRKCGTCNNLYK